MELDDLKTTWKSIGHDIPQVSINNADKIIHTKKNDVKTSLCNRFIMEIIILFIAICLLGTSGLWAPISMPFWWIFAFCILFASEILYIILLIRKVKRIDLGLSSHFKVMNIIISIKKFYRNVEISGCAMVTILMVCGIIFSPIPYKTTDILFIMIISTVCFILEYLWYKSNIKKLNKMQNWLE